MTALTRVLRRLRYPWVTADGLAAMDRKDGLDTRRECPRCLALGITGPLLYPPEGGWPDADRKDTPPSPSRYDVEWPSVLAAEVGTVVGMSADEWSSLPPVFAPHSFVGGDLAAMAAPFVTLTITPDVSEFRAQMDRAAAMADPLPGMARDALGTYAELVKPAVWHDAPGFREAMDRLVPYVPTPMPADAFDRIMGDLWSLDRELDAFADGRAYEAGTRCRTDSAALRRAGEHLADGPDGARRAALVLAGFTGAETGAV